MTSALSRTTALVTTVCLTAACADHSSSIPAQYVSPMQYDSYSCKQIGAEMQTVSARVSELGAQNDKIASNDEVAMGVGLVLLWPALFFLDRNSAQAAEYGRLKGEFDALEKRGFKKTAAYMLSVRRRRSRRKKQTNPNTLQKKPGVNRRRTRRAEGIERP